jgi:hypothetical protein
MRRSETPPDKTGPDTRDLKSWLSYTHWKIMEMIRDDFNASEFALIGDLELSDLSDTLHDALGEAGADLDKRLKGEE